MCAARGGSWTGVAAGEVRSPRGEARWPSATAQGREEGWHRPGHRVGRGEDEHRRTRQKGAGHWC